MLDWALLNSDSAAHKWLKKWQGYADKLEFNMFWSGLTYRRFIEDLGLKKQRTNF